MASYNKIIVMGNITRTPETRHTQGGTSVTKFGMATNRKFKDHEEVCFVDLTAFGKVGEIIAQYCDKGDPLLVEGRLSYSTWEDKDGGKRSKHEVIVENMQLLGGRKEGPESTGSRRSGGGQKAQPNQDHVEDDELPF
jgi:single-strand DNA-binding protein